MPTREELNRRIMRTIPPLTPALEFQPPDVESPEFKKASALTPEEEERATSARREALETVKNIATVYGPLEAGANLASQLYGLPIAGLAQLAGLPFGKSEEFGQKAAEAIVYQPRTEAGQQLTKAAGYPFEVLDIAGEKVADVTREKTGSPLAATTVGTAVKAAPLALGLKGKGLGKVAGKVLKSEKGVIGSVPKVGSKIVGLKSTQDAYALGKGLSRDEAQAMWEQYKARPKGKEVGLSGPEMTKRAFEDQMMRESVEGHVRGGEMERLSMTPEEIDAYFSKPVTKGIAHGAEATSVEKWKSIYSGPEYYQFLKEAKKRGISQSEANESWGKYAEAKFGDLVKKPVMKGIAHGPEAISVEELSRSGVHYSISKGKVSYLGKQVDLPPGADAVIAKMPDGSIKVVATKPGLSFKDAETKFGDMVKKTSEKVPSLLKSERGSLAPAPEAQPKGWTYPLQTAIEQKMPNSAPVEQVRNMIKGAGIKEDEIKWSGLDDFLKDKTKVSKAELLDHLKANQVELKEVVKKPGPTSQAEADSVRAQALQDLRNRTISMNEFEAIEERIGQEMATQGTKFSQWQLPGAEDYSYREMLLTLPKVSDKFTLVKNNIGDWDIILPTGRRAGMVSGKLPKEKALNIAGEKLKGTAGDFTSSHWDEPNVLAHIRFNDHVDAQVKKVLFIEEVQSDWHQAGRERGYIGEAEARRKEFVDFLKSKGGREPEKRISGKILQDAGASPEMLDRWYEYMKSIKGEDVPPAPFSKTWHEMAMRRMVRWAAENGYDKIAWTTGEQQVGRYIQSIKQLKEVVYNEKTGELAGTGINGETVRETVSKDRLSDYIGKPSAQALLRKEIDAQGNKIITSNEMGEAIKAGGEHLRLEYDTKIPSYMNKFGKKWGAKVGETEIGIYPPTKNVHADLPISGSGGFVKVHSLDITPSMKKSVIEQGLPLFQLAPPVAAGAGLVGERLLRKGQPEKPATAAFDPEGTGYDMESAKKAGMKPDATGHWSSRDPKTGLLLKGRKHETWPLTVKGEEEAGYEIYKGKDGRYYSREKSQSESPIAPQYKSLADVQEVVKNGTLTKRYGIIISKQKGWIQ